MCYICIIPHLNATPILLGYCLHFNDEKPGSVSLSKLAQDHTQLCNLDSNHDLYSSKIYFYHCFHHATVLPVQYKSDYFLYCLAGHWAIKLGPHSSPQQNCINPSTMWAANNNICLLRECLQIKYGNLTSSHVCYQYHHEWYIWREMCPKSKDKEWKL